MRCVKLWNGCQPSYRFNAARNLEMRAAAHSPPPPHLPPAVRLGGGKTARRRRRCADGTCPLRTTMAWHTVLLRAACGDAQRGSGQQVLIPALPPTNRSVGAVSQQVNPMDERCQVCGRKVVHIEIFRPTLGGHLRAGTAGVAGAEALGHPAYLEHAYLSPGTHRDGSHIRVSCLALPPKPRLGSD